MWMVEEVEVSVVVVGDVYCAGWWRGCGDYGGGVLVGGTGNYGLLLSMP